MCWEQGALVSCSWQDSTRGKCFKMKDGRFRFDIGEKFLPVGPWHRFCRGVVDALDGWSVALRCPGDVLSWQQWLWSCLGDVHCASSGETQLYRVFGSHQGASVPFLEPQLARHRDSGRNLSGNGALPPLLLYITPSHHSLPLGQPQGAWNYL